MGDKENAGECNQVMFYFNYDKNQLLILYKDQEQPEVNLYNITDTATKVIDEPIAEICVCKWYRDIGYDEFS
jgi:hypothetical protein